MVDSPLLAARLYLAIRLGVDIDPLLSLVGTHKDQLAHVLGTYAAALTASAAFYPVSLTLTGIIVPRVGRNVEAPFRESMLRRLSRRQ